MYGINKFGNMDKAKSVAFKTTLKTRLQIYIYKSSCQQRREDHIGFTPSCLAKFYNKIAPINSSNDWHNACKDVEPDAELILACHWCARLLQWTLTISLSHSFTSLDQQMWDGLFICCDIIFAVISFNLSKPKNYSSSVVHIGLGEPEAKLKGTLW